MILPVARLTFYALLFASLPVVRPVFGQEAGRQEVPSRLVLVDTVTASQVEAEIVPLIEDFWAAVNQRDSTAVIEMLHPRALFVTTGVRKDRGQLMADFAPWGEGQVSGPDIGFKVHDFRVMALSESTAIVNYILEWNQVHPRVPSKMLDSHVWVKQDGRWMLVFAHDSVAGLMEFLRSAMEERAVHRR